jgi:predicted phosphodiesterase
MLRILSDLHFRDASSRLRRLEDLGPLLEGVDTLWLNGDTCDNQSGMPAAAVAVLVAFFRARVPVVHLLTGNHDPDISDRHWCTTAGHRLVATHGDVFFDDIVPWGSQRDLLVARRRAAAHRHPEIEDSSLPGRIALHRLACTGLAREVNPEHSGLFQRLHRFVDEFFPPRKPLAMLRVWRSLPDQVAALAPAWFPGVQVVVTGHVHFPRVWRRGDLAIINTGAFAGPLGAYAVDLEGGTVTVRHVRTRGGAWYLGRVVATIRLTEPLSGPPAG